MASGLNMFLKQALRNPAQLGAIAPSSQALGRCMAQDLGPHSGRVVEIGAGTGAVTNEILRAGVAPKNLALFELNPTFCTVLRRKFPQVSVHGRQAQDMGACGLTDVDAVISGLPLLNMPRKVQHDIVSAVFNSLRKDGVLVQFTYGAHPPITESVRRDLGLGWIGRRRIWLNLPPARVYVFSRNGDR